MAAYALILAAGFSTRMVSHFKPLLPMPFPSGCRTALSAVCALYRAENVHPLVIGGYRAEKTEEEALACGAGFIHNAHPEAGMFSSIRTGAAALPRDCSHFFVHPVDIPLVRRITIQSLLKAAEQKKNAVYLPVFQKQEGHPPLFSAALASSILLARDTACLRDIVEAAPCIRVPVADSFILRDMDTPEDYMRLCTEAPFLDRLSPSEAEELLIVQQVPERGRAHGLAVGKVAAAFADALSCPGEAPNKIPPDRNLALAGGLVHDIRKGSPRHEEAAGRFFRSRGMEAMAVLVESHRDMTLPEASPFSERELVFLADKYVRGSCAVSLEERFLSKMEQFSGDAEACTAIRGRMERAKAMAARFSRESGQSPEHIARLVLRETESRKA